MTDLLDRHVYCPYCNEVIHVIIEVLEETQEYIEDCQVCCRPIVFHIGSSYEATPSIVVHSEDDTY